MAGTCRPSALLVICVMLSLLTSLVTILSLLALLPRTIENSLTCANPVAIIHVCDLRYP